MSEIKWIKIVVDMFEDNKIEFIRSLPEGDSIIVTWMQMMSIAGKSNMGGYLMVTDDIPYSEQFLATKLKRSPVFVQFALETLMKLRMVNIEDGPYHITNWEKHQNVDGMEKVKLQNKERKRKQREREKTLLLERNATESRDSHVTVTENVMLDVTPSHATDIELDKEKDKKITERKHILSSSIQEVIEYLNMKTGKRFSPETKETVKLVGARLKIASIEDCKKVIDVKVKQWKGDSKMDRCLKPNTLFAESNFEAYLNESIARTKDNEYVPVKKTELEYDPYLEAAYAKRGMGKDTRST